MLVEEVRNFAVLVVALRRHKHAVPRLLRQVLADLRDRKHDLLQRSVAPDHLDLTRVLRVVMQRRVGLHVSVHVWLGRAQSGRQGLVVTSQLPDTQTHD